MTVLGQIDLPVTFGDGPSSRTEVITFDVVRIPYQYNAILGRTTLHNFGAIAHHNYLCMKIPTPEEVITIPRDQDLARQMEMEATMEMRHVCTVE